MGVLRSTDDPPDNDDFNASMMLAALAEIRKIPDFEEYINYANDLCPIWKIYPSGDRVGIELTLVDLTASAN